MTFSAGKYDVIVIGAGHAGSEAALASSRLGCRTLCLTISMDAIALMPCNPAVGGPGKSHLVREVDALGGEIALNADKTFIQMRMINTGKGPAVRALRCQSDKRLYQYEMSGVLQREKNLHMKQDLVEEIIIKNGQVKGVITLAGAVYWSPTVILAGGTYLRGRIIMGDLNYSSGPAGYFPANKLSDNLRSHGFELVRFNTSTPARIDGDTVDYSSLTEQVGDEEEYYFSYMSHGQKRPRLPCWLTYTNTKTHEIILENLDKSPLARGEYSAKAPRYCPSIEDKVVRFTNKESHQVFLEPEGWDTKEIYVQGMSTSLPLDIQLEMLRSIKGLGKVEIMRPGYAIEYDCIQPKQLELNLGVRGVEGLYSAGQMNGTSGYEEAAAQGILAGINAAMYVKGRAPVTFSRSEAYIGVLVDDLVTKGTEEPYRILTSRAEYRLLLRQDNADLRLTEKGRKIGLVDDQRYEKFIERKNQIEELTEILEDSVINPGDEHGEKLLEELSSSPLKKSMSIGEILKRPELDSSHIERFLPGSEKYPRDVQEQVWIEFKYEGYIKKQIKQVENFKKLENRKIPPGIEFQGIRGMRMEAREKLQESKPMSVGQASRIPGVSPADINMLLIYLEQRRRETGGNEDEGG